MGSVDHVDLVVSSLERSPPFYRGLLEPLGYTDVEEIKGERGEQVVYLSRGGTLGAVGLRERQAREGESFDRYALGIHHLALRAEDREAVDRADPDGLKIEVVHR